MKPTYNPHDHEDNLYADWERSGLFNPDNLPGERTDSFAVLFPPPNVTGVLHLGHALETTLMDTQVRFERMRGKRALLLPGTDHAAVATQARVEDELKKSGSTNPRQEFGREGLLEKIRDFAESSKATILSQVRKMGTSADWSRLAYTFDDQRSEVVTTVFKRMYDDGLIYRGYRVVNWSVQGQCTASNDEVQHEERTTQLYTFRYSTDFPIPIATVLPETKLGDTAVAVHPDDERYKQHIGQKFTVDVGAAKPLNITVIADTNIDPGYGTGALGVTPAHSDIDFEMYQKNPDIGLIQVVGADGRMTTAAGPNYAGLTTDDARKKFVDWLRQNELMISEEDITHNITVSDRFKDPIWPIPMEQWFVNVDAIIPGRDKSLKQLMREAVTSGHNNDASKRIIITPDRFEKIYLHWIDNLHDWCISRQIWWGHRIPVWYKGDDVYCGTEAPAGKGWVQDEDTLDTWFSSGMWTFSTLGWPDGDDFTTFHPTAWIQMGHEILFLWMARMVMFTTYMIDDIPFKEVYIHGILRAKDGRKFSKSLGNGIDPLDVIEKYGTDALRLSLVKGISPGNDARFYEEKVEHYRNFINKLWNLGRFIDAQNVTPGAITSLPDRWIQSRVQQVITDVTTDLEQHSFSQAAEKIYDFVWHEFADWYIEMAKNQTVISTQSKATFATVLKLLHPFTPFVTEVLGRELGVVKDGEYMMISQWPVADPKLIDLTAEQQMAGLQELVSAIRDLRSRYQINPSERRQAFAPELPDEYKALISQLVRVDFVEENFEHTNTTYNHSVTLSSGALPVSIGVSQAEQTAMQDRFKKKLALAEDRAGQLIAKLSNPGFMKSAPAEVQNQIKESLEKTQAEISWLESNRE